MVTNEKDISRASAELQDSISNLDVDAVGIVGLDEWQGTKLEESALRLLPTVRSLVVPAMEIYPEILDLTSPERIMGTASLNDLFNRHMEYLGGRLTKAVYDVARTSRRAGLKALPLPSLGCPVDARFMEAILSYKHAAQAAGLGHIGLSSLLITHEFGPRVRFAVCLTEAALKPTTAEFSSACRSCNICISKCPSGALDWPQNNEPYIINKFACQSYRMAAGGCSECMRQCPVASPKYEF